jgi:hypothetical protein
MNIFSCPSQQFAVSILRFSPEDANAAEKAIVANSLDGLEIARASIETFEKFFSSISKQGRRLDLRSVFVDGIVEPLK